MGDHDRAGEFEQDDFEPASMHLHASLVPRRGSPLTKAMRTAVTLVVGIVGADLEGGPSVTDLRVIRRDTGNEVLRVSAGTVAQADQLLLRVRRDLDTKNVAEFVAEWRLSNPHS